MRFAKFPESFPILISSTVLLRDVSAQDIPAWFARATDAESADLAGDPIPSSIEAGRFWVQSARDRFDSKRGLRWEIVPNGSLSSVGTVGLAVKSNNPLVAELGFVIGRESWSQGIGTAAARLVTAYGFSELGLREIEAHVLERNPASIRVLLKLGFQRCGILAPTEDEPEELLIYRLGCESAADSIFQAGDYG
ncbi:MAG: GNAT family N-acetyltransferase [Anaerolineales bacterium]|nr:GNAT family N-acetyltransferase [Anaerolineales bacterium]